MQIISKFRLLTADISADDTKIMAVEGKKRMSRFLKLYLSGSRSVNWISLDGSQGPSPHHTMWTTEKWQASTGGLLHITLPSSLQLVLAWRLCRSLGCEGRIRPDDIEIWAVKGWTWVDDIEIWALEGLNLNKLYRNLGCKGVNLSIWYQNLGCEGMNLSRWYRNSGCSG